MQYIIDFVRTLISSPEAQDLITDQQIQDQLDRNSLDIYTETLTPGRTLTALGEVEYHTFYAKRGFWEDTVVLQNPDGTVLTPDVESPYLGKWTFTTAQTEKVLATGTIYNVYYATGLLCMIVIESLDGDFNFTADGLTVQRINQLNDLQSLAKNYMSMGWNGGMNIVKMVRKDLRA